MKHKILLLSLFISFSVISQDKKLEKLRTETLEIAFELYKSELASWHSTDILNAYYKDKFNLIGGYLSYTIDEDTYSVYYDRTESKNILFSVVYPNILIYKDLFQIDTLQRTPNEKEKRLIRARETAVKKIATDTKQFFTFYENSNYNFIPIIYNRKLMVYTLTGPTEGGVVLIGNDYKFEFDKSDKIKNVLKIHNSLLAQPFELEDGSQIKQVLHSHVVKDFPIISETDLCTLMLYEPYVEWETYTVLSKEYVSIWNMKKKELILITRKAWEKIRNSSN